MSGHIEGWWKQIAGPSYYLPSFYSVGLEQDARICLSNKCPEDADALVQGPHFRKHCCSGKAAPVDLVSSLGHYFFFLAVLVAR